MVYHIHLLVNANVSNPPTEVEATERWLEELVTFVGMELAIPARAYYVSKEGNKGITAVVGLQTSHASIHVWDEEQPAKVRFDLYTCGTLEINVLLEKLKTDLGILNGDFIAVNRKNVFTVLKAGKL